MREQWVDVEGFEENYAVSNYGEVLNKRTGQLIAQRPHTNGHMRVTLYQDGRAYERYVTQLVARAFFNPPVGRPKMAHVNGDPSNNRVDNVRFAGGYVRTDTRERKPGWGGRVRLVQTGAVFRTVGDCARHLRTDPSKIYSVLRGSRVHHLGYTFEWYEGD